MRCLVLVLIGGRQQKQRLTSVVHQLQLVCAGHSKAGDSNVGVVGGQRWSVGVGDRVQQWLCVGQREQRKCQSVLGSVSGATTTGNCPLTERMPWLIPNRLKLPVVH